MITLEAYVVDVRTRVDDGGMSMRAKIRIVHGDEFEVDVPPDEQEAFMRRSHARTLLRLQLTPAVE